MMVDRRSSVRTIAAAVALGATAAGLSGCLEGERPPLSTIYGDPAASHPALSEVSRSTTTTTTVGPGIGVQQQETTTTTYGTPGATATETPVAGSTSSPYGNYATSPYGPYGSSPRQVYRYGYDPYGRPYATPPQPAPLPPGTPRYVYPGKEVRCDNTVQGCYRWSGRQGVYVWDTDKTRELYGPRAAERGYPPRQQ